MRALEIIFVLLAVLASVLRLRSHNRSIGQLVVAGAIFAMFGHWIFEGAHWQMMPAYIAIVILCIATWKINVPRRAKIVTSYLALFLVATSILFSYLLPMFSLPRPTGPYAVGTSILYLKDSSRIEEHGTQRGQARELMVQLWYPARPSNKPFARYREARETNVLSSYQSVLSTNSRLDAPVANVGVPFPVILFNHAWRGRRTNYTFLTEELASHGYVIASIDHTYNAQLVAFPDGRVAHGVVFSEIDDPDISTPEQVKAIWNKELVKWVADQRFVLDQMEVLNRTVGTLWFGHLNTKLAGAVGHSFGGSAAVEECATDSRVHAAANMDGWFFEAIHERGPNQSLLYMYASDDQVSKNQAGLAPVSSVLNAANFADVERSMQRFGGDLLAVKGAAHDDFSDQPLVSPLRILSHSGVLSAKQIQDIVRTYMVAFFDKELRGKDTWVFESHSDLSGSAWLEWWPKADVAAKVIQVSR
jgi:predicted dienelactone hydrolase